MSLRICFVCLGNICRSPMAEVVMRSLVADRGLDGAVEVSSAGTGDWHIGQGADKRALETLGRHGYDGTTHRAQQFVAGAFDEHDVVVALDRSNLTALRRLAPAGEEDKLRLLMSYVDDARSSDVPDPYYGGDDGFEEVLAMVESACRAILDRVESDLPV